MPRPRKRTVAVATGVSAALVASSTAFALANGIFGARPNDRVGGFRVLEQQLAPAEQREPVPTTVNTRPKEVPTTAARADAVVPQNSLPRVVPASRPPNIAGSGPTKSDDGAAPDDDAPTVTAPAATSPTTHSTASTVPRDEHEDERESTDDNGRDSDD